MKKKMGRKLFVFIWLCLVLSVCCGKRGPSLPPFKIAPDRCSELSIRQIGDTLLISFLLPDRNTDGSLLSEKPTVELLQFISESDEKGEMKSISGDEFLKKARPLQTVGPSEIETLMVNGRVFLEQNIVALYGEKALGKQFSYAVQLANKKKKRSPLSDIVSIVPVKSFPSIEDLTTQVEEEGVRLSWKPPQSSSGLQEQRFFNIYRVEVAPEGLALEDPGKKPSMKMKYLSTPLNEKQISENSFLDTSRIFGNRYLYSVRVVYDAALPRRESPDSIVSGVKVLDVFPPRPPSGLSIVTDEGIIRLFWFPNAEHDLSGYKVYRKSEEEEQYKVIASLPAHMTSFSDKDVAMNMKYSYYVTAFDSAQPPNESAPSEVVIEAPFRVPGTEQGK